MPDVYVTNRSDIELTDGWNGVMYEFKKDETVQLPFEVARHIFGVGLKSHEVEERLARLGWIQTRAELKKGLEMLEKFEISSEPPSQNHSLPSVVELVPQSGTVRRGGKVSQRVA
jgi:hypothetical protein